MRFIAALNEVLNKSGAHLLINVLLSFLNLEESNPAYLSEKTFEMCGLGIENIWSIAFFGHIVQHYGRF